MNQWFFEKRRLETSPLIWPRFFKTFLNRQRRQIIRTPIGECGGLEAQEPEGKVLASATKLIETNLQPREAEAFALRWAIILCARLLLPEVAFETDCLKLVQQ